MRDDFLILMYIYSWTEQTKQLDFLDATFLWLA